MKYRVFNNKTGEYMDDRSIPFGLAITNCGKIYKKDNDHNWNWQDITDDCTVELCTGMKDKNGKDIYVGDILQDKYERNFTVKFYNSSTHLECKNDYLEPNRIISEDFINTYALGIIGTIHKKE